MTFKLDKDDKFLSLKCKTFNKSKDAANKKKKTKYDPDLKTWATTPTLITSVVA